MNYSNVLLTYRAINNITQAELAKKMGISTVTISNIETGKQLKLSNLLLKKVELLNNEKEVK